MQLLCQRQITWTSIAFSRSSRPVVVAGFYIKVPGGFARHFCVHWAIILACFLHLQIIAWENAVPVSPRAEAVAASAGDMDKLCDSVQTV